MNTLTNHLNRIATDIDREGVTANETAIAVVVQRAASVGVNPVLVSVLADPTESEVVRARAFGMVAGELARMPELATAPSPALAATS